MPSVHNLFRAAKRGFPMEELLVAEAISDLGFGTCVHARKSSKRQVLLVDKETLDAMDLQPGIVRENITTVGLNVNGLKVGERLRVGQALLEVSMVCTPCDQLEKVRPGLRREMYGRRGMLCTVRESGIIQRGDAIARVAAPEAALSTAAPANSST